jgi:hypothetical protein
MPNPVRLHLDAARVGIERRAPNGKRLSALASAQAHIQLCILMLDDNGVVCSSRAGRHTLCLLVLALRRTTSSTPTTTFLGNVAVLMSQETVTTFTSAIPRSLFTRAWALHELYLSQNMFSGRITPSLTYLTSITRLELQHNAFTGTY